MNSIKKYRPDLYDIYNKDISFYDYLKTLNQTNVEQEYFIGRRIKFIKIIEAELRSILDDKEIGAVYINNQINTTDHFGIMQTSEIINNTLSDCIRSENLDTHISFPGGKVPLNNVTQPFILNFQNKKIDIFNYYKDYTKNEVITLLSEIPIDNSKIDHMMQKYNIDPIHQNKFDIFKDKKKNKNFVEQCIRLNRTLFNKTIDSNTDFLFLEKYYFVQKLLIRLLEEGNNVISSFFQDKDLLQVFSGKYGTDLFRMNEGNKLRKLRHENGLLYIGENLFLDIIKNKEDFIDLLEERKLVISLEIMFCILSFYLGYECLGGLFQIKYLGGIKENRLDILKVLDTKEYDNILNIRTDKLIGGFSLVPDKYLIDYLLEEEKIKLGDLENEAHNRTIQDCINVNRIKQILRI